MAEINPGFLEDEKLKYFKGIPLFKEIPDDCWQWLNEHETIVIGTYNRDEPYIIENDDGTISAIASDYMQLMFESMGVTNKIQWKLLLCLTEG